MRVGTGKLKEVDILSVLCCRYHDWHYEGMEGLWKDLRDNG